MDTLYREHILDHYKHPQNFVKLDKSNASAGDDLVSCGDQLFIELLIENDRIREVGFQGKGCAISIASASILTELIKGKQIKDLKRLDKNDILKLLGVKLSPTRLKCALLSLEVLHKAIVKF